MDKNTIHGQKAQNDLSFSLRHLGSVINLFLGRGGKSQKGTRIGKNVLKHSIKDEKA
jgi:hypothetical protein